MNNIITIAITSCGRYELLEKTIKSIEQTIDLKKYKKILTEDSRDKKHVEKIREANANGFLRGWKIIYTGGSGQADLYKCHYYALKTLYDNIDTKYVFHCEDDQIFKRCDFDYFKLSCDILENNAHIGIVLLRDLFKDFGLRKTGVMRDRYYDILTDNEVTFYGHNFIYLSYRESFTLQPGLRNTELMKKVMFGYEDYVDESLVGLRLSKLGYNSIVINPGIYNHINPIFNSTKNIKNLGFFRYIHDILKGTITYRGGLVIKFIKNLLRIIIRF